MVHVVLKGKGLATSCISVATNRVQYLFVGCASFDVLLLCLPLSEHSYRACVRMIPSFSCNQGCQLGDYGLRPGQGNETPIYSSSGFLIGFLRCRCPPWVIASHSWATMNQVLARVHQENLALLLVTSPDS